ncbi:MAG TPA: molybdopterin-binding protein [Acidimicrobiales bacterium]|jgi:molybdenum cofactor synthesis domain-containing protein|nr:molybdopterin-binding protein [Acidimicrobiales bacterium]
MPEAKVLTVSDGVASGHRVDRSGAALQECLRRAGYDVVGQWVIADGAANVERMLRELSRGFAGLIVTTGGTGFGPRDETPEGTRRVIEREATGLVLGMFAANPDKGRLSRATAGATGAALVVNTPGSTKGAVECLEAILDVVPHALDLLAGRPTEH